ncbi:MAG: fluoride efflux transporter CrcB [Eubacteriales bacterium]|nr:fluoride efflux transporter CrcB [Eubacteriales bacterium]
MRTVFAVGMGGFFGSICRYLLSLIPYSNQHGFPVKTMVINVLGALLLGVLVGLADRYTHIHSDWFTFLQVGFCGGFTTFSTFALETTSLIGSGRTWVGVIYISVSIIFGVAAIFMGKALVS